MGVRESLAVSKHARDERDLGVYWKNEHEKLRVELNHRGTEQNVFMGGGVSMIIARPPTARFKSGKGLAHE